MTELFLSKFLEVPCLIFNPDESELYGKREADCELIEVYRMLGPSLIESFCETIPKGDFREDNKIWTSVCMKSSDDFIVNMSVEDFKKLLSKLYNPC